MTRRQHPRELRYSRVSQWQENMSQKFRQGDGSELDMQDAESIRSYVRKTLAQNVEPSPQALQRLKMMLEVADSLPKAPEPAHVDSPDELAAARERLRKSLGNG